MSLIQEALDKVEQKNSALSHVPFMKSFEEDVIPIIKERLQPKKTTPRKPHTVKPKGNRKFQIIWPNQLPWWVGQVGLISGLMLVMLLLYSLKPQPIQAPATSTVQEAVVAPIETVVEEKPEVKAEAPAAPVEPVARTPESKAVEDVAPIAGTKEFILTGITFADGEHLALINNRVFGVGDWVKDNARIEDIRKRNVVLVVAGKKRILTFD